MDPERSAGLFYAQLAKFSYDSDAHPPGWYAQQIQRSAYPDRYDQRFQEASDLFDSLTGGDAVGVAAVSPSAPKFQERDFMTGGGRQTRSRQPTNFLSGLDCTGYIRNMVERDQCGRRLELRPNFIRVDHTLAVTTHDAELNLSLLLEVTQRSQRRIMLDLGGDYVVTWSHNATNR